MYLAEKGTLGPDGQADFQSYADALWWGVVSASYSSSSSFALLDICIKYNKLIPIYNKKCFSLK